MVGCRVKHNKRSQNRTDKALREQNRETQMPAAGSPAALKMCGKVQSPGGTGLL